MALKDPLDAGGATRVVKTTDHELALESKGELLIGFAELHQPPLGGIHRVDPTEQCCVGFSDLERDLGSFTWIGSQPQCLFQVNQRRFPPCTHLCAGCSPQESNSLLGGGWFCQCAVQQVGCHFGRAILDCLLRGLIQSGKHPVITRGSYRSQMRGNLPGGGSIGVQQTGGGAMGCVSLVAAERRLKSVADDGVDEARRIIIRQDFQTN